MSTWEVATWLAIVTLVFGSLAVFVWFLVDAVRWVRMDRARRRGATSGLAIVLAIPLGASLIACAGDRAEPSPEPNVPGAVITADQGPATRHPAAPRIVAFADVHGDLEAAREALRLAGAIDESDRWIGGDLVVVQTGDQLDRGDQEREILHLFARLVDEAAEAGGAFHPLNGNHELMNAHRDLRYITEGGFRDFDSVLDSLDEAAIQSDSVLMEYEPGERGRVAAFRPGGPYALMLAERNTIVVVGETVFVHGGVLPEHAAYGIEAINEEVRAWLRGEAPAPEWSRGSESPIWTRLYSQEPDEQACAVLEEVLQELGVQRMVVGHTVHREGITPHCDGRLWAADVGMASYYGGPRQVLEIRGDTVTVLGGG